MAGTLYIVATPIGNLEDITQRALRILREVQVIACEDTRRTKALLNRFEIKTPVVSYHEHNERERAAELVQLLDQGNDVAVVSDAGTPLISDPGFRLVNIAIEHGLTVTPIPGPTAFVAALVSSGLATDQFFFAGFLPARANARRRQLESLAAVRATLIFYEAPHRIASTLKDSLDILGDRQAAVARELTKIHEETARGTLSELAERYSQAILVRGEIVLLISGANLQQTVSPEAGSDPGTITSQRLSARVNELESEGLDPKTALKKAARELGLKRAEAYRLIVVQKNRRNK
jgi:16S rRNA (cytidine1402-2'-O)-methyltransferase